MNEFLRRPVALKLPEVVTAGARVLGTAIVAVEIVLPLLVALRVTGARWLLLGAQVGSVSSPASWGFALTGVAAILLLWPRPPTWAWPVSFVAWAVAVWLFWIP